MQTLKNKVTIPLGYKDLQGNWHHNPALKMSPQEQLNYMIKHKLLPQDYQYSHCKIL